MSMERPSCLLRVHPCPRQCGLHLLCWGSSGDPSPTMGALPGGYSHTTIPEHTHSAHRATVCFSWKWGQCPLVPRRGLETDPLRSSHFPHLLGFFLGHQNLPFVRPPSTQVYQREQTDSPGRDTTTHSRGNQPASDPDEAPVAQEGIRTSVTFST